MEQQHVTHEGNGTIEALPEEKANRHPESEQESHWKKELLKIFRSKFFVYVVIGLAAVLVLRFGLTAFEHQKHRHIKMMVDVVHPAPRTIDNSLNLPGNFEAIEQASLYAHINGYLKKILVDEGDKVKKGQLMAIIDAPDVIQEYNRAKADYDLQAVTLKRNADLLKGNVISEQEYDTVNAAAQKAQARLQNAEANVGYTEIRAPFDGAVARRFKYPGDLIEVGKANQQPIFIVVNESTLRIAVNVPQVDATRIEVGYPVDILVDALPNTVLHGKVSRIDDLLDSTTKTQRVLIDIENPNGELHAGMFATVDLHLDHKDNALSIPKDAVVRDDTTGKTTVWVVRDGKLQDVPVTLGIQDQTWTEVTSGLTSSDDIVLSSSDSFTPGTAVDVHQTKPQNP